MHSSLARTSILSVALSASLSAQLMTTRVSVDSAGLQGNQNAFGPALSADGRFAAFISASSNLVASDGNGASDVFVRDRQTGTTTCVSVDTTGIPGNGTNLLFPYALSDDARYVSFLSDASNLVTSDTNGARDVFVRDRQLAITRRVSVDSSGTQANDLASSAAISANGRYVAFSSKASNLVAVDTNNKYDTFVHDLQTSATTLVSLGVAGAQSNGDSTVVAISGDGRYVLFGSTANNLVSGDTNVVGDVFLHDRTTGQTTRVSVDSSGIQANSQSFAVAVSADGRYSAFLSYASNLVGNDTNAKPDAFVHDRVSAQTTRVSVDSAGAEANGNSFPKCMSPDGRFVVFASAGNNLVAGDTNSVDDVFVHDRSSGQTLRVSLDSLGAQANAAAGDGFISADARFVGFSSGATNLVAGDTNGKSDAFVREFGASCATQSYCTSSTTANGCSATMFSSGTPSASATSGFTIGAANVEGQRNGLIFYGINGRESLPWATGSTSFLCVKVPTQRTFVHSSGGILGQCNGQLAVDWSAFVATYPGALGTPFSAGAVVDAQAWFRDPPAPKHSSMSDGLEFIVCP